MASIPRSALFDKNSIFQFLQKKYVYVPMKILKKKVFDFLPENPGINITI